LEQLPMKKLYPAFLEQLKQRRKIDTKHFNQVPAEMQFLAYFADLKESQYQKLSTFLESKPKECHVLPLP
jgi:hypothetical protein